MLEGIINSKSKTFLAFCFCFLIGVLIISVIDIKFDFIYFYLFLFIILSFIIYFWSDKKIRFIFLCLFLITIGVGRYLLAFPSDEIKTGKAEFIGFVASEPDMRQDGVRYVVETHSSASVHGKIYLKYGLYPRYNYGDELKISCDLEKPEKLDDGYRYDMYLARMGVFAVCRSAEIEKIGSGKGNLAYNLLLQAKEKIARRINSLWHEPYAGFMAGLLYGYRGGMGDLAEMFNRTGVTHIIAISGYNISIVASVLIITMSYLFIPRKKAFWLVAAGIFLFVIFAGMSPSVVRAGVMGLLVLVAGQVGRLSRISNLLAFTAVLMVLINPLILFYDAGFQLSFVATIGLVYLSPLLEKRLNKMPECWGLKEILVVTLSAIIMTLPLILYQFGRLSIVAPAVNILILWLIPFLMLFGFLAVLLSFLFYPLGEVVAWITWVGLKYIIVVVKWFAGLNFASVDLQIPFWAMVGAYVIMIYFLMRRNDMII